MASEMNLSTLQIENADFLLSAASVAQALQQHHFALLRLVEQDGERLGMVQTLLKDNVDEINTDKAALQPSKQFPGRDVYEYSLGQNMSTMPLSVQKTAPQAFHILKKTANAVLTALAKSPFLKLKANSFDSILEDPVLDPGMVSCSSLDVGHSWDPGNADCNNNDQAVADKGLLTVLFADTEAGLQVFHPKLQHVQDVIIPAGCVVVLPGYTLERASCGIFKAALYKLDMKRTNGDRLTLAFKLRASPSAVINLHADLPSDVKSGLDPRYAGPITTAELMWWLDQSHTATHAPTATTHNCYNLVSQPDGRLDVGHAVASVAAAQQANHMQITFEGPGCDCTTWHVDRQWTIGQMRLMIQAETGIPIQEQELIYRGKPLMGTGTLMDSGVVDGAMVTLCIRKAEGSTIAVSVRMLSGKVLTLDVEASWTVLRVKQLIQDTEGTPVSRQRLLLPGETMSNSNMLSDYGIENGHTLFYCIHVRGG